VGCYTVPDRYNSAFYDGEWDEYWCRWLVPQETYFGMAGPPNDMFTPLPVEWDRIAKHCKRDVGVAKMELDAVHSFFGATSEAEWEKKVGAERFFQPFCSSCKAVLRM
jgi:hypothetical protein